MKIFTKQLYYFITIMVIMTFFHRICNTLKFDHIILYSIVSVLYVIIIPLSAFFLVRRDAINNALFDLGLRFHLSAFTIWVLVSFAWYFFGIPNQLNNLFDILRIIIYWIPILISHLILLIAIRRRKTIKGISKDALFNS